MSALLKANRTLRLEDARPAASPQQEPLVEKAKSEAPEGVDDGTVPQRTPLWTPRLPLRGETIPSGDSLEQLTIINRARAEKLRRHLQSKVAGDAPMGRGSIIATYPESAAGTSLSTSAGSLIRSRTSSRSLDDTSESPVAETPDYSLERMTRENLARVDRMRSSRRMQLEQDMAWFSAFGSANPRRRSPQTPTPTQRQTPLQTPRHVPLRTAQSARTPM